MASPSLTGLAAQSRLTPKLTATPSPLNHPAKPALEKLVLHIDNRLYDVTKWQSQHPGGGEIMRPLHNRDATEAFYSLHSKEAVARLHKMYSVPSELATKPTAATVAFRQFRADLVREGLFEKSIGWEVFYHSSVYTLTLVGTVVLKTQCLGSYSALAAIVLIGLAQQQSGWIGHDYTHSRGRYAYVSARVMSGIVNAFSPDGGATNTTRTMYTPTMSESM